MEKSSPLSPRFETSGPIHAAGLRALYPDGDTADIPRQWEKLGEMMPRLPPQKLRIAYGICFDRPKGLEYVAAIDVGDDAPVPSDASKVTLPARRYAVFVHEGDVTGIRATCDAIWRDWAPTAGCDIVKEKDGAQYFFERYGPGFDYRTGSGDIEIWVPVR